VKRAVLGAADSSERRFNRFPRGSGPLPVRGLVLPHSAPEHVDVLQVDLLSEREVGQLAQYDHAIWVAGNADHGIGWIDPIGDLESQVMAFLRFLSRFRGSPHDASSQAVFLIARRSAGGGIVPNMPYGFSKLAAEKYAQWALESGRLERLWIHRLMYTFGPDEKPRRLLARCIRASQDGGTVTIAGNGRSFLNPIPVTFLARVLERSSMQLAQQPPGYMEVTNINHPEPWTVLEVAEHLCTIGSFAYKVVASGERWPDHHGRVDKLSASARPVGYRFPMSVGVLAKYRDEVLGRGSDVHSSCDRRWALSAIT
jgi:nucleoside-diphosphate-sugar epimerase